MEGAADVGGEEEPMNKDPAFIGNIIQTVIGCLELYGWYIIAAVIFVGYLWHRFQGQVDKLRQKSADADYKKMDSGVVQSRLEAMERSRQKMQQELDAQAKEHAEKLKKKEEEKRLEKIKDWEGHQQGKGYRNKSKRTDDAPGPSQPSSKPKKSLKPGYSPLSGDDGGVCFRPSRRGGAAGGG